MCKLKCKFKYPHPDHCASTYSLAFSHLLELTL